MTLSVTYCPGKFSGCIYHSLGKDARLTPSRASHCFMTSGAITPVHVASGMNREDVAGSTSCERCAPQDTRRDIQFAGEPTTCEGGSPRQCGWHKDERARTYDAVEAIGEELSFFQPVKNPG